MGNRIEGNVYILDTQSGNTEIPFPSAAILGIAGWFSGPTGEVQLSGSNTTNVIVRFTATNSAGASSNYMYLGDLGVDEIKLPVLIAGTAWIYFK